MTPCLPYTSFFMAETHASPPHLACISPISPSRRTTSPLYLPTSRLYLPISQEDHMTSFFLAETLKYLYLLFDEAS